MRQRIAVGIGIAGICVIAAVAIFLLKPEREVAAPPSPGPAPGVKDRAPSTSPATANRVAASADRAEEKGLPSAPPPSRAETEGAPNENTEERRPTFVRAEEAGEDFSKLESSEVLRRLTQSDERIAERKAAKVLGDRHIAGKLSLPESEQQGLGGYVEKQIGLTAAADGSDREEANQQIQRLWRLATDQLIDNLGSKNMTVVEAATKNLALMRNEDVVRKIIAKIEGSEDVAFRRYAILALGMMREKRDCLVPGRDTLSDEDSAKMVETIIVPFLEGLQKTEKDPETLQFVKMAFHFLEKAMDTRLRPSEGR
jgi:hypothetical protein